MSKEPLAIVGIGCRFPGNISNPNEFWTLLKAKGDTITEVPAERWSNSCFHGGTTPQMSKSVSGAGGFLPQVDEFDAEFFGMPAKEAAQTDPQHRLLLELTWEALEDAGLVADDLAGSSTGVFVGISGMDYALLQLSEMGSIGSHASSGSKHYLAANRISYTFNLTGPSIALDAACATSLIAVDMACQSLWQQRCNLALVGGVNLQLGPQFFVGVSQMGALSPDGRCKPFSAHANGYGRSDGAAMIVLKPVSAAIEDGDEIYAVIRASATNHGGYNGQGWMVPSQEAQLDLLNTVYDQAGIDPAAISYIEAHGTGTRVGDRIESAAVGAFIQHHRDPGHPLRIGSVKGNLGHTETAAGLASLCKVALMLKHRQLLPTIHCEPMNPDIPFEQLGLRVVRQVEAFPEQSQPLVAGVSCFGIGGANAHVVVEEFVGEGEAPSRSVSSAPLPAHLMPFSARHPVALRQRVEAYLHHCQTAVGKRADLADLAYTLAERRSHLTCRAAFVATSAESLHQQMTQYLSDSEASPGPSGHHLKRRLAFVFSGMGPQWWGMGRELLNSQPVFRERLEAFDTRWQPLAGWSMLEEMQAPEGETRIGADTQVSMAANIALQIALAALWQHWGIVPDVIVGHSVGEVAAAYVSGGINLDQVVQLTHARLQCVEQVRGQGTMAAVGMSPEDIKPFLMAYSDRVTIAAINSPQSLTIAGDTEAITELAATLQQTGCFCRILQVDVPFHGLQLRMRHAHFARIYPDITPAQPCLPYVSSVTGRALDIPLDKAYWLRNFEQTVHFNEAVHHLIDGGCTTFLELGPHPVLGYSITECLRAHGATNSQVLATLRRDQPEYQTVLGSLATLYTLGYTPQWAHIGQGQGQLMRLPTYPWHKQSYWNESVSSRRLRLGKPQHPLLGQQRIMARTGPLLLWENLMYPAVLPYLEDYRIRGEQVLPSGTYLEMIYAALTEAFPTEPYDLVDIEFHQPLSLPPDRHVALQVIVEPQQNRFDIYSSLDSERKDWVHHLSGVFTPQAKTTRSALSIEAIRSRCLKTMNPETLYERNWRVGYEFGPRFQTLTHVSLGDQEALIEVRLPETLTADEDGYHLHPVLLESAFQAASALPGAREGNVLIQPVTVGQFQVFAKLPQQAWLYVQVQDDRDGTMSFDLTYLDASGHPLAQLVNYIGQVVPELAQHVSLDTADEQRSLRVILASMEEGQAGQHLSDVLCQVIGRIRGLSATSLEADMTCDAIGLDSLMRIELVHWVQYQLGVKMPVTMLYEGISIEHLAAGIIDRLDARSREMVAVEA